MPKPRLIFTALLLFTIVSGLWAVTYSAVPRLINYQGRLTDKDSKPLDGAHNLAFRIYDAETAGNLLWEEIHQAVVIQKGIFSILLGSVTKLDLPFDKPYFLEIKVGDEVMSPRQQVTSAAYAIKAERAEKADKAEDANTVANVGVSAAPQANKLLPLDNNAKLPLSAVGLKVYDSGWFAVATGNSYTKTHNLGTTKVFINVQFSQNADGSSAVIGFPGEINNSEVGAFLRNLTNSQITYDASGPNASVLYWDGYTVYHSGYARIIMFALE